jgi:hypothetical protein
LLALVIGQFQFFFDVFGLEELHGINPKLVTAWIIPHPRGRTLVTAVRMIFCPGRRTELLVGASSY